MNVRWKLRMAAAQREVWTGAELRRLLADKAGVRLSSASVSALMTKQPTQVKLSTLAALCTALECTPNDLFDVDTSPIAATPVTEPAERVASPQLSEAGRCHRYETRRLRALWGRDRTAKHRPVSPVPGRRPTSC